MSYWRNRLKEEDEKAKQRDFDRQLELERTYQTANDNIERDVRTFFDRYASREGISPAQAKRRADVTDLNILSNKAEQYVADKDFSNGANVMLRNYNLKGRVTREELLKHRVGMAMHELGYNEEQYMKSVYNDEIHRQMEMNAGIWEMTVPQVDTLKAMTETIINKPFYGDTWSNRIWKRQDVVAKYMNDNISKAIIQGKNATTLVNELRNLTGRSSREAKRLLVTETARIQTDVQKDLMTHNGYEVYEYIAESTACEICAALDGETFDVNDMTPGVNAAPMHPHCRCASAPSAEFERSQLERMLNNDEEYEEANEQELQKDADEWWNGLTGNERDIIRMYTDPNSKSTDELTNFHHSTLNERLYEERPLRFGMGKVVDTLDGALNKFNLKKNTKFYRGMNEKEFYAIKERIEDEINIQEYKSTSANRVTSESFAGRDGWVVEFRVPKNSRGAYLGNYSAFEEEKEFLIARNTELKLVELDKDGKSAVIQIVE